MEIQMSNYMLDYMSFNREEKRELSREQIRSDCILSRFRFTLSKYFRDAIFWK